MTGRVLVVEDDSGTRQMLVTVLEAAGYDVEAAEDGAAALAQLAAHPPDVVVLDLKLPVLDGWAFLEQVRARPDGGQVPVLIVSGSERQAWDPARVTGVLGYLPKPFGAYAVWREVGFLYEYARTRGWAS